jgi:thiol-disulfide isomerase/thioredoxin
MAKRAVKTILIILAAAVLLAIVAAGYYFGRISPLIKAGKQHGVYATASGRSSAADFGFETEDGAHKKIADLKGKVVGVDVWATWCGTCIYNIPKIASLHKQYSGQSVEIIGLNVDSDGWAKAKPFLQQHPEISYKVAVPYPEPPLLVQTLVDLNPLGSVSVLPTIFVIDRNGAIAGKFIGGGNEWDIDDLVSKLLEE